MDRKQMEQELKGLNLHQLFEERATLMETKAQLKTAYDALNSLVCRRCSLYAQEQMDRLTIAHREVERLDHEMDEWDYILRKYHGNLAEQADAATVYTTN